MALTARETVYSIFGAYRLAMLDKSGLSYLDRSPEGAIRSFYAALIVLPALLHERDPSARRLVQPPSRAGRFGRRSL